MEIKYLLNAVNCPSCNKEFRRTCDLSRHYNTKHGDSSECLLCHKVLKSGMRRDVRVRHLMHSCTVFSKSFVDSTKYINIAKQCADDFFRQVQGDGSLLNNHSEEVAKELLKMEREQ